MYGKALIEEANAGGGSSFGVMRLGPQSKAERLLSRAMDLSPSWPEVHLALAQLRLEGGALRDPAMALSRASEAVRLTDRKNASALATLAAAQAATGSPAKALTTIGEALTIAPDNKEYLSAKMRYASDAKALRR
jgi:Tfp pilus assembly protein PilF